MVIFFDLQRNLLFRYLVNLIYELRKEIGIIFLQFLYICDIISYYLNKQVGFVIINKDVLCFYYMLGFKDIELKDDSFIILMYRYYVEMLFEDWSINKIVFFSDRIFDEDVKFQIFKSFGNMFCV